MRDYSFDKTFVLAILDGWGYSESTVYNAIHGAYKPCWDSLWENAPRTLLQASGVDVGLPPGQMGNSEVGHLNMGAGRIVYQEFTRISRAIETGDFFSNDILMCALDNAVRNNKSVHLLGLLSTGGVHGHEDHIFALIRMAAERGVRNLYLHAFLDGRDTRPKCAEESIQRAIVVMRELGLGKFASIIGRFYAMDRNKNWDRTLQAYDLVAQGKSAFQTNDPLYAVDMAYKRGESDEFVQPTAITHDGNVVQMEDGDVVLFCNYRADRARQLSRALTKKNFVSFPRERFANLDTFVSLTEYKANYEFPVAFPPERMKNVLGEVISQHNMQQLRVAETEKYAHVTFFFNGGEEHPFRGEDRALIPSPRVQTYDLQPEMSAEQVTDAVVQGIAAQKYSLIVCNYANPDMVGHSGDYEATVKAVTTVDQCITRLVNAAKAHNAEMLLTADHGNAEQMREFTTEKSKSGIHKAHTNNLVPFVYLGKQPVKMRLESEGGILADIAPTALTLMGIPIPKEMAGSSLVEILRSSESS